MIKIGELKELLKLVFFTGYVAGEKPVSVMLVGEVGIGKSELVKTMKISDNIVFYTDVTYMGIIKLLEENKEVRHIVIPDFLKITMKKKSTTDNITSCFNALMEEGLDKISMMGQQHDFKGKKVGVITATTRNSFNQHKRKWEAMGFLSRMLIVSYDYSDKTKEDIFKYIFERGYLKNNKEKELEMPVRNLDVKLLVNLAKQLREKDTTFRKQKQLQALVMANALLNNRFKVLKEDVNKINNFKKFINLNYTKI